MPSLPDFIAKYVNFIIDFLYDTTKCCETYRDSKYVDKDLLTFAFLSSLIAFGQLILIKNIAIYFEDTDSILNKLDFNMIEFVGFYALAFLLVHSVVLHHFVTKFRSLKGEINVKNTVNAVLAFYTCAIIIFLFLFTICLTICLQIKQFGILYMSLIFILVLFIILFSYKKYKYSLKAMHPLDINTKYLENLMEANIPFMFALFIIPQFMIKYLGKF